MELVLKHFRSSTMVSTQLNIALAWCQRMSGISKPLLEYPSIQLPHLETSFSQVYEPTSPPPTQPLFWKTPMLCPSNGSETSI